MLETSRFFAFFFVSFAGTVYKHLVRLHAAALFILYKKTIVVDSKTSKLL